MDTALTLENYINTVCKIGQGALCCKYLVAGTTGLECCKIDESNKAVIDKEWAVNSHNHTAQGDNCEGQDFLIRKLIC
jgi:hypothetical protein